MAVHRTWWVKLRRAKKHISELEAEHARLRQEQRPYKITQEIETDQNDSWLIVRGYLPPFDGDDIAAIVGDIIFNTRAALDHIYVSLTGKDDAQFPILKEDIWKPDVDPRTGKDRNKCRRDSVEKYLRRLPGGARTLIEGLQPYATNPQRPEDTLLAILNQLSNADKHRRLLVISTFLCDMQTEIIVDGQSVPLSTTPLWHGSDGAVLYRLPFSPDTNAQVHATGGIEIALKETGGKPASFELPESIVNLVLGIEDSLLKPLDSFIT